MRKIYRLGNKGKVLVPIQSIRELPVRAGKTSVSVVHLPILLCGFPKALFTKTVYDAMHCWRFGECAGGKVDKKSG